MGFLWISQFFLIIWERRESLGYRIRAVRVGVEQKRHYPQGQIMLGDAENGGVEMVAQTSSLDV